MAREMKDSGIEWIGEIPKEWELVQLRRFVNINNGREIRREVSKDYSGAIGVYGSGGIFKYTDEMQYSGKAVMFGRKGTLGKPLYVDDSFWTVDTMYFLTHKNGLDERFNYYQLIVFGWEPYITHTAIPSIVASQIVACHFPIPNRCEQNRIAAYLDKICVELDNVLEKTCASIEEYKKLKQAVITQAVTKGIGGDREMKDSLSIWFGQIPRDWNMRKIKYIFKIQKDIAGEEGHTVLSITQKGIKPKDLSKNEGQLAENYSNYQLVHIGNFAMNHMDLLTGWVDVSKYEGVTSPDYRVFGLIDKDNYCSQYYLYLMQMCYTNRIFYGLGQGVSGLGRWRLQADKFLNFSITVPSYQEQKEIANYLDQKCSAIDELIAKKEQYLSEIENYKNSLIYEYVTGKKEVPQNC